MMQKKTFRRLGVANIVDKMKENGLKWFGLAQ